MHKFREFTSKKILSYKDKLLYIRLKMRPQVKLIYDMYLFIISYICRELGCGKLTCIYIYYIKTEMYSHMQNIYLHYITVIDTMLTMLTFNEIANMCLYVSIFINSNLYYYGYFIKMYYLIGILWAIEYTISFYL